MKEFLKEYEGRRPPSLDLFLDFVGLTEDEFNEVAESHMVSPYLHDRSFIRPGTKTPDFEKWSRVGGMPREESMQQVENWRRRKI